MFYIETPQKTAYLLGRNNDGELQVYETGTVIALVNSVGNLVLSA